jgi:hypothetical protein
MYVLSKYLETYKHVHRKFPDNVECMYYLNT